MSEPTTPPADPGLPPVEPPSAQLMVRLFLVPGLIVAGLVLLFLAGPMLYRAVSGALGLSSSDATADQYLRRLDSDNLDIRYRAASDLAQVLLRNDELAADPVFALELASRLAEAIDRSEAAEKKFAERFDGLSAGEKARESKALEADRVLITYLGAALGNTMVPAGASELRRLAGQTSGMEALALAERRRLALFALGNLGMNAERFDALPAEKKEAVLEKLTAARSKEAHTARADAARKYLEARMAGKPESLGVLPCLVACAAEDDPFLRQAAALASNFWQGTPQEEADLEAALVTLAHDDGRGQEILDRRREGDPAYGQTWPEVKRKGYAVQANAVIALARRGSTKTRLDVLEELLNPEVLATIYVIRSKDGSEKPDHAPIAAALFGATRAVPVLASKRKGLSLDRIRARLEELVKSSNRDASVDAARALKALADLGA
jgi:hypothetical protein